MRKIATIFLAILMLCSIVLVGCSKEEKKDKAEETKDYSALPFVGVQWERDGEHDSESIRFGADGSFGYSCGCGNPVNDSDLCEGFTYDEQTQTITLECIETTDEMITVIKVVKCEENELHLDFDGEIRIFTKQS